MLKTVVLLNIFVKTVKKYRHRDTIHSEHSICFEEFLN